MFITHDRDKHVDEAVIGVRHNSRATAVRIEIAAAEVLRAIIYAAC